MLMADDTVRRVGVLVVPEADTCGCAVGMHVDAVHAGGIISMADLADLVRGRPRRVRIVAQGPRIARIARQPVEDNRFAVSRQKALGRIGCGYGASYTFDVRGVFYMAGLACKLSVLPSLDAPPSLRLPPGRS